MREAGADAVGVEATGWRVGAGVGVEDAVGAAGAAAGGAGGLLVTFFLLQAAPASAISAAAATIVIRCDFIGKLLPFLFVSAPGTGKGIQRIPYCQPLLSLGPVR
jgi:hypothetical protein